MSLPKDDVTTRTAAHGHPKILMPGEGPSVVIGKGARCTFKVIGKETNGLFGLFEYEMNPGTAGPKPHIHREMEEIFYVARGEVELLVGDRQILATAGTLAFVPRDTVHAFANPGDRPSVLLILFCPADSRENYFKGLAKLTRGGQIPDKRALMELMRMNDQEPVETEGWTF